MATQTAVMEERQALKNNFNGYWEWRIGGGAFSATFHLGFHTVESLRPLTLGGSTVLILINPFLVMCCHLHYNNKNILICKKRHLKYVTNYKVIYWANFAQYITCFNIATRIYINICWITKLSDIFDSDYDFNLVKKSQWWTFSNW
jgi:hypothetical protein